ncbi:MotA/TolQ/ExbB proton channel family protein [Moritella sp. 24]|nr:MotA/TolQ/ExbB proton channel family protein [Moritella sp. 24]
MTQAFLDLQSQLGLMTLPLLLCSAITLTLVLERLVQFLVFTRVGRLRINKLLSQHKPTNDDELAQLAQRLGKQRGLMNRGVAMLIQHRHFTKSLREDAAGMWLQQKRQQLRAGLKLLALIGVLSPLLGLLGTVIGLIDMFKAVAVSTGAVTPNDLADGLGVAMHTTAAGLLVALPAIAASQLLGLWADKVINKLEHGLNFCNLWLEGLQLVDKQCTASPEVAAVCRNAKQTNMVSSNKGLGNAA